MTLTLRVRAIANRGTLFVVLGLACVTSVAVAAPCPASAVCYTVSLANPERHVIEVAVTLDTGAASFVDLRLPVWNALYQVRDFSQYVTEVRADAGARIEKLEKSAWRVTPPAAGPVEVRYRIVADRPGPFGAELDSRHAFLNPAQVLMYSDQHRQLPVELRLENLAPGWRVATALSRQEGVWKARNYDHLADSPFEISAFDETGFSAGGGEYRIIVHAERGAYSMPDLRRMVERIVAFQTALMEDVPFARFTFLYHFREGGGGGMEHADSTAIDAGPQRSSSDALRLAGLTAHEFFHLWNVKRIRPRSLEPVDYTREQYTRALWFSEGVTSTYASYTLLRAGMTSGERFLEEIARDISQLEARPAARRQSAEDASLDAWLERYPPYGSPERSISYYQKGKIVGFLLDLAIRQASENRRSLDDLLRYLNQAYARAGKFFDERAGLQAAAEAVAGRSLQEFFDDLVRSPRPVPYARFFEYAGLALREETRAAAGLGFRPSRRAGSAYTVQRLEEGGPAVRAGLLAGDEVLEVNGRPPAEVFPEVSELFRPGDTLRLKLRRAGREFEVRYKAASVMQTVHSLVPVANPSALQQKIYNGWLKAEKPSDK